MSIIDQCVIVPLSDSGNLTDVLDKVRAGVRGLVLRKSKLQPTDVDDVVQEAEVRLLAQARVGKVSFPADFLVQLWLTRAALHIVREHQRHALPLSDDGAIEEVAEKSTVMNEQTTEDTLALREVIALLPAADREIIEAYYLDSKADRSSGARSRAKRAKARCLAILRKHGFKKLSDILGE